MHISSHNNWYLSKSWTWGRILIPCPKQLYNIRSIRPTNCIFQHEGGLRTHRLVKDLIMDTFGKGPWKLLLEISLHISTKESRLQKYTKEILSIVVLHSKIYFHSLLYWNDLQFLYKISKETHEMSVVTHEMHISCHLHMLYLCQIYKGVSRYFSWEFVARDYKFL